MSTVNLAEALYRLRLLQGQRPRGLIKDHVKAIEHELCAALIDAGRDPGVTAEDADALKLSMLSCKPPAGSAEVGCLEAALEDAAERHGSQSVWRELDRFTQFCARMRLSKPGEALIEDDKLLPVYRWCRTDGRAPASDFAEAAQLYLGWTSEALAQPWKGTTE